jgi:hypothetical protein
MVWWVVASNHPEAKLLDKTTLSGGISTGCLADRGSKAGVQRLVICFPMDT